MDGPALASFEARADAAEKRLAVLEAKLAAGGGGGGSSGGVDAGRYISELKGLRDVLLAARVEQEAMEKRVAQLESQNGKLQYQVVHLKRAVQEGDAKLLAAQR